MTTETAVQTYQGKTGLMASAVSPGQIVETIKHVHDLIREAMTEGIEADYAVIPGTKKKTLLKPGAEKLLLAFGLAAVARPPQVNDLGNNQREVIVETEIRNLRTGETHAVGIGSCSTLEKKYRYRPGPVEFTGKPVPREYWNDRKQELLGGPGYSTAKNPETGNWEIVLKGAEVENADPADTWNTVLKMAGKRSMIDGVLRATASSAMFTQDMEDTVGDGAKTSGSSGSTPPASRGAGRDATPPATGAAAPAGGNIVKGIVTEVSTKSGSNAKGPWTKYGVKVGGIFYNTFSATLGAEAQRLKGGEAVIEWKANGEYRDLVSIVGTPAEAEAPAESAERTAEDEAFDRGLAAKGL